jgi:uncharacterized protein YbjT (DUF2867 family)
MKIAVAGGTGVAGRRVVEALIAAAHEPVVLARSTGVDVLTGAGLDAALAGVDAVVDATNKMTTSRRTAVKFFETAGRNLTAAASRAGVGHFVTLSIVGIDRVDYGYYEGKLVQEKIVRESGLPYTILRATQFHEFADQVLKLTPGPVAFIPRMQSRTVAVSEVGQALAEIATSSPQGMVEIAGPQVESMLDLARRLVKARGAHRVVLPLWMPGSGAKAMASGGLLPTDPNSRRGRIGFDEWLATVGAPSAP